MSGSNQSELSLTHWHVVLIIKSKLHSSYSKQKEGSIIWKHSFKRLDCIYLQYVSAFPCFSECTAECFSTGRFLGSKLRALPKDKTLMFYFGLRRKSRGGGELKRMLHQNANEAVSFSLMGMRRQNHSLVSFSVWKNIEAWLCSGPRVCCSQTLVWHNDVSCI